MRFALSAALLAALVAGCSSTQEPLGGPVAAASAPAPLVQPVPAVPPNIAARTYSAIVVDAKNGKVLYEHDASGLRYPASLTKMMTLYLVFDELDAGRLTTRSPLQVSAECASRPPAKIGVKEGEPITVDTAVRALAVRSANDVACVIGENLAGSEDAFAARMTAKARSLGMMQTQFRNASGLPDPAQYTTARDVAILGRALHKTFPRWFRYFSTREFTYGRRTWKNTNRLLPKVVGMNGIKTGYIRLSGFNLATSVERDGKHIIAVVIGGTSGSARNAQMETLIENYLPKASGGGLFGF